MRVCVTGGAGFIGSHLVAALLQGGHEVVVLDDLSTGRRENLTGEADGLRFVVGDIRDGVAVAGAVRDCEVVCHLAALASVARSLEDPRAVADVNVGGTLGVLTAAREAGVRRVVLASSSSVYGNTDVLPKVESLPFSPCSPYAATKCAAEAMVDAFRRSFGLEGVIFRLFNVYGPRQRADSPYAAAIPRFVEAMVGGRAPTIEGDGEQTRDFTYVGDVVRAFVRACEADAIGQGPMNLGAGRRMSILEVARAIASATGYEGGFDFAPARPGDVRDSLADSTRVRAWLGWQATTPLDAGIRETVASFSSSGP